MAETSPHARVLDSPAVRVRRFASPRSMSRGAGWCLLGLLLSGALMYLAEAMLQGAAPFLLVPLGILAFLLVPMTFFCGVSALILWLVSLPSLFRPGRLLIEDALCVEHGRARTALPLVSVTGAEFYPESSMLALRTRDGDVVEACVDSHRDAQRVLDAIATGTVQKTWIASLYRGQKNRWLASPPLTAAVITTVGSIVISTVIRPDVALSLALSVGIGAMIWGALRDASAAQSAVIAGSDGISIEQGGLSRFIAFTRITSVHETHLGLRLSLAGGEAVELTLIPPDLLRQGGRVALSIALAERRRAHLRDLVRAEIAPREEEDALRAAGLLERKGRSVSAWRAALAELLREAAGDYRRAILSRDQAAQVLEDGKAPAELRIGAALALAQSPDPSTFARVRIAIETSVNPAVRIALTQASYGDLDDETLESALRSGEAEAELSPLLHKR